TVTTASIYLTIYSNTGHDSHELIEDYYHVIYIERSKQIQKLIAFLYNADMLDKDVVIQMFSPLVASYRIMKGQFKNPYESLSCEDGTKFVFQEYQCHCSLCIGAYSQSYLNRFTNVSIKLS
ncbi:hypothetical protein Avbf_08649, partial [Armadillidium vulgare]